MIVNFLVLIGTFSYVTAAPNTIWKLWDGTEFFEAVDNELILARCDGKKSGSGRRTTSIRYKDITSAECSALCEKNPYCTASYVDDKYNCVQFKYCDVVHMKADQNIDWSSDWNSGSDLTYGSREGGVYLLNPVYRNKFTSYPNSTEVHVFPEAVCNGILIGTKNSNRSSYTTTDAGMSVDECAKYCKTTSGCMAFTYSNMGGWSAYFPGKCQIYKTCKPIRGANYDLVDWNSAGPLNLATTYVVG